MEDVSIWLSSLWFSFPVYVRVILLVSFVVLFRPRTNEAYKSLEAREPQWFWKRLANAMRAGAAISLDLLKFFPALGGIFTGKSPLDKADLPKSKEVGERGFARRKLIDSLAGVFCLFIAGCALLPFARTVLNVAEIACLIGKESLSDDDLKKACQLSDALVPEARKYISAQRMAAQRDSGSPSDASSDAEQ